MVHSSDIQDSDPGLGNNPLSGPPSGEGEPEKVRQQPVSVAQYREKIAELLAPGLAQLGHESVAVGAPDAVDRVLARPVLASLDLPPFTNSQVDGYAVRAVDLKGANPAKARALRVAPPIPAGYAPAPLEAGTAAPVMTGAMLPAGADAVVPIEESDPAHFLPFESAQGTQGARAEVRFTTEIPSGRNVRTKGSDAQKGQVLLDAGVRLTPARLGLVAASGRASVEVRLRPRVLILATGTEVRAPGETLESAQIYDANSTMLAAAAREAGASVSTLHVQDDPQELLRALGEHIEKQGEVPELILSAGGISAGAFEVVREAFSGQAWFGKVAMQPGGPQGHGTLEVQNHRIPLVAFPGNPVSALISFEMFVRPLLLQTQGLSGQRPERQARLAEPVTSIPGKLQVRRGVLNEYGHVLMVGGPSSHLLNSYAHATHLVFLPVEAGQCDAGDLVTIWEIS